MGNRLATAALVAAGNLLATSAFAETECRVSKAQYDALSSGISYAQAVSVLGCHGEELSSSEMAGYKTVMFMWSGNGFGGNMNAMFQNGELINKAQFGLK